MLAEASPQTPLGELTGRKRGKGGIGEGKGGSWGIAPWLLGE